MYQIGVYKKRRAVGSIIAGAFIVLIILSGYEFYLLNNRAQNDYQQVLSTVRTSDIERSQEDLKFTYITADEDEDTFKLKIRNDGPELAHITYAAIFLDGVSGDDPYIPIDSHVTPSSIIDVTLPYTNIDEDEEYFIQIITERGNIFPINYPQDEEDYPYIYILSGAMSDVIGDVLPIYDTFRWAEVEIEDLEAELPVPDEGEWEDSWAVPYDNKECTFFRFEVTYYGDENIILGANTGLYFKELTGPKSVQAYIVYRDGNNLVHYDYEDYYVEMEAFDPDNPTSYILYFATSEEFEDLTHYIQFQNPVAADRYQVILGIYEMDPEYSQAFSLIAIEVVDK
ncbi:hypothetical protein ACFL0D_04160 [Thermoproteota archaeon]